MRLVVHAVQTLHDRLLQLVDHLGALARLRVDLVDALIVHLHLELLRPAPVAAQPAARTGLGRGRLHEAILWIRPLATGAPFQRTCTRVSADVHPAGQRACTRRSARSLTVSPSAAI